VEAVISISQRTSKSFYDAICAMIVVTAMPVANAKARAIPTKIFFMIVLNPLGEPMNDKAGPSDLN
jgi:hypothetical protein